MRTGRKPVKEGDTQSWYAAWSATADRVLESMEPVVEKISQDDQNQR
jgi:hypothetical protein